MRTSILIGAAALVAFAGCGDATSPASPDELEQRTDALLPERSFAITDEHLLKPFPLERVLKQLVSLSGVSGLSPLDLFQQMWDTQNPAPGAGTSGPHCDDQFTWQGHPGLNDFPWECPRFEGYQAGINPFGDDPLYIPIGLFNRFDLAPATGAHCGEYRIVYAMRPGHPLADGNGRNFIIFEGILPNPNPQQGLAACVPVAKMWANFSFMPDSQVEVEVEEFYFKGRFGFAPVVHPHHYGLMLGAKGYACSSGQIRTNQFNVDPWTMREYKLALDCRCGPCNLDMIPLTVKTNPYADLFNGGTVEPLAPQLESTLTSQIASLAAADPNEITYGVDDSLNAAESPIDGFSDYLGQASSNGPLHAAISAAIPAGVPLNSTNIIDRALTQSCAGCHLLSDGRDLGGGVTWPHSLGFVHIEEFLQPNGRYPISSALTSVFIPYREKLLLDFLNDPSQFNQSGEKCMLELPPELEVDKKLCSLAEKEPKVLTDMLKSSTLRSLRVKWEGRELLGRRSGH